MHLINNIIKYKGGIPMLKEKYIKKEDLAKDIIKENPLTSDVTFAGIDENNRFLFDINIKAGRIKVSDLSEIQSKMNFADRYFYTNLHRVQPEEVKEETG